MLSLSDRTSLEWGLALLQRWPALSLVKLLGLIGYLLYTGIDQTALSVRLPLVLLLTAPLRAVYLSLIAQGLQGRQVGWRHVWSGFTQAGGPLLLLWLAVYIVTRLGWPFEGFLGVAPSL